MGNLPITAPGMARGNQAKELGPEPASPPAHGLQDELTDGWKWGDGGEAASVPSPGTSSLQSKLRFCLSFLRLSLPHPVSIAQCSSADP